MNEHDFKFCTTTAALATVAAMCTDGCLTGPSGRSALHSIKWHRDPCDRARLRARRVQPPATVLNVPGHEKTDEQVPNYVNASDASRSTVQLYNSRGIMQDTAADAASGSGADRLFDQR